MRLEQWEKELAAIGASIGCNCRPCIEHHIAAGREAGLSDGDLADAVATARVVRDEAIELFAARIDELLGGVSGPSEPATVVERSRVDELVSIGASVGANSHPLLCRHIAAALELGLSPGEVKAALKMAAFVQQRASEMTAESAKRALDQLGLDVAGAAARS
jgi:AhpD family alkylhydroperoxidase